MSERDKIFLTPQEVPAVVRADFFQYGPQKPLLLGLCPLILGSDIAVVKEPRGEGVWISTTGRRRFIDFTELGGSLCSALEKSSDLDLLADVCRRVFRTTVYPGKSKDGEREGLWLETGMENFNCRQCGDSNSRSCVAASRLQQNLCAINAGLLNLFSSQKARIIITNYQDICRLNFRHSLQRILQHGLIATKCKILLGVMLPR